MMRSGEVKMIKTIHPQLCCVVINPIPLLINFTSFAQLQIKDKLRTFPRREGFTRNKGKISSLICFYLLYPIPYALPRLGKRVFRFSHRFPSTPKESFDEVIAHSSKPSFWFFQIGIPRNSINIYSISFLLL